MRSPSRTIAALTLMVGGLSTGSAEPLRTSVTHAILIDAATRTVLFERGADDPAPPASTSKLMTAEIVFEKIKAGALRLDQTFPISETAWRQGGAPSHGSTMFAKLNSQVSVENLLQGLVVDSANDAAIALAEGIAGSQGAFATLMIQRARELGFDALTFTDSWGDANPDQTVTPRQMALLADHIIETYPDLYKMFGQHDFLWNNIKQPNRNPLLLDDIGADGLKTGNLDDSGYSIVGSAVQNGERLIVAIYGAKTAGERAEESRKLLQWGFRNFDRRTVFLAGATVGSAEVYGGESRSVPLVTNADIAVLVPRDGEKMTAKIAYRGPLAAPITTDGPIAELRLYRGPAQIVSLPLRAGRPVAVGSLPKRALDAGLEYMGGLFRKYVLHS